MRKNKTSQTVTETSVQTGTAPYTPVGWAETQMAILVDRARMSNEAWARLQESFSK